MRAQIIVTPGENGSVQIEVRTQEGSFEQGEARVKALVATLETLGVKFTLIRPTEQHRHAQGDTRHVHLVDEITNGL